MDWWCPVAYDAAPALTGLIDDRGSRVTIDLGGRPGTQAYVDGTLVLQTALRTPDAAVALTDFMAGGRIVRQVSSLGGRPVVRVVVDPGAAAQEVAVWAEGVAVDGVVVRCGHPFTRDARGSAVALVTLDPGGRLVVTVDPPAANAPPLSPDGAVLLQERAVVRWRHFIERVETVGPYDALAARSAMVVHALAGVGGAPVASPATSLPRVVGGERNRDGRVARPADAAAWALAAASLGLAEDADAAVVWMVAALEHDTPLPGELAPDGSLPPSLSVLPFSGWQDSQPVVSGTDTADRPSVEPAAAVVEALARLAGSEAGASALTRWDRVVEHADWLADHWGDADSSTWAHERRDRRWTSARLAARSALAAAAASARSRHPLDLDAAGWQSSARDIGTWLLSEGVMPGAVLSTGTGSGLSGITDAALIRAAFLGPWPEDDQVVGSTIARVMERLGQGPWVHPYSAGFDDGYPADEPPSVVATLWVARALALQGRWDEAHERMEAVVALGGPLHLLPEAVDPVARTPLGNRLSAPAHIAFIEAAAAFADAPD